MIHITIDVDTSVVERQLLEVHAKLERMSRLFDDARDEAELRELGCMEC